jgi:hypothetical protein
MFGGHTGPLMPTPTPIPIPIHRLWSNPHHRSRPHLHHNPGTIAIIHRGTILMSSNVLAAGGRFPRGRHRRDPSRSGETTRLRGVSAILVLRWATGCAATAMPAVPPLSMSPSKLDAYRMSTFFTQRQRQQARFASCLMEQGYQPAYESCP